MDINELKFKLSEKRKSGIRLPDEQKIMILKVSNQILKVSHKNDHCFYIAIEELSELIAAINEYACFGCHQANLDADDKLIHLYEEIADVTIIIDKVYDWFNIQRDFDVIGNESAKWKIFHMNRTMATAADAIQSITKYLRYRDSGDESEVRLIYEMMQKLKEVKYAIDIMVEACHLNPLDIVYTIDIKYERQSQRDNNMTLSDVKTLALKMFHHNNIKEETE